MFQIPLEVISVMRGVRFELDEEGRETAAVIDLKEHAELWEDFYDRLLAESRREEPRESLSAVKKKIGRRRQPDG